MDWLEISTIIFICPTLLVYIIRRTIYGSDCNAFKKDKNINWAMWVMEKLRFTSIVTNNTALILVIVPSPPVPLFQNL